jgi:hypothetical protein
MLRNVQVMSAHYDQYDSFLLAFSRPCSRGTRAEPPANLSPNITFPSTLPPHQFVSGERRSQSARPSVNVNVINVIMAQTALMAFATRRTGGVQAYMASTDVGIASSLRRFSSFSLLRCAVTRLAAVASHFARALIFTLLFALHSPYLFTPLLCYSACCCPDAASHSCALIFSLLFTRLSSYLFTPLARTLLPFTSQPNIAFNLNRETDA